MRVAPWLWAMRVPALIRYVAAEPGNLLAPSWDGPKMYFNIEARPHAIMTFNKPSSCCP